MEGDDEVKDEFIKNFGIKILRIRNDEVEKDIEEVTEMIL